MIFPCIAYSNLTGYSYLDTVYKPYFQKNIFVLFTEISLWIVESQLSFILSGWAHVFTEILNCLSLCSVIVILNFPYIVSI